jgi:hypothetical protein
MQIPAIIQNVNNFFNYYQTLTSHFYLQSRRKQERKRKRERKKNDE